MDPLQPESAFAAQINVKMSAALKQSLENIYAKHAVPPAELLRRLAIMAVSYEHEIGEMPMHGLRLVKREPLSRGTIKTTLANDRPKTRQRKPQAADHARDALKQMRDTEHGNHMGMDITQPQPTKQPGKKKR